MIYLGNILCALDKNLYSFAFGWNSLDTCAKLICYTTFNSSVSLLAFYLNGLSIDVSGVLKFPGIIVWLSISPFRSVNICFIYLVIPMLGA